MSDSEANGWRVMNGWHVGRSWSGHRIEDECPCPQEPCGLVVLGNADPHCQQHQITKSYRQGHPAGKCPGAPS